MWRSPVRSILAAVALGLSAVSGAAQDRLPPWLSEEFLPANAYGEALLGFFTTAPSPEAMAELRERYRRSLTYTGCSLLAAWRQSQLVAPLLGRPAPPDMDERELSQAIVDGFPLLETQLEAASLFRNADPPQEELSRYHFSLALMIAEAIRGTEHPLSGGTGYVVLTATEQYAMLEYLGVEDRGTRALVEIGGRHYDIWTTDRGRIGFDVGAFFRRSGRC